MSTWIDEPFRQVVEAAPLAMVLAAADGTIELVNSRTEAWFGYARGELIGKPVEILLPQRFRDRHPGQRAQFMQQPQPRAMGAGRELYGLRKDGTEFPVEIGLTTLETPSGTKVLGSIIDISVRRAAEERFRARAEEIATASRFKSEFLATLSHELRTPLNSILLLADQLRHNAPGNLTSGQVEDAAVIHRSGLDLLALVNDVLDLSRVEAGRMPVRPEPVSPRSLADDLRLVFAPLAAERGLALELAIAPALPGAVLLDRQRVLQIARNLVSNALKYTEAGSVRVSLFAESGRLAIAVADTGPGIPASEQAALFEPFRKGLGLAISRRMAALLGGEVTLESELGRGSTFTLRIPLEPPSPFIRNERGSQRRVAGARALIAEDDPVVGELLVASARAQGFEAILARTAAAALQHARETPPDAIVLDLLLPDMSGWQLLDELQQMPTTAHAIVCVLSNLEPPQRLPRHVTHYRVKPADAAELAEIFTGLGTELARSTRLLLVADDPALRRDLDRSLHVDGFHVTACPDLACAQTALSQTEFPTVLAELADAHALERLAELVNLAERPDLRFVVRAQRLDPEQRARLAELGAVLVEGEANTAAWLRHARGVPGAIAVRAGLPRRVLIVDDDARNGYALGKLLAELELDTAIAHNGARALQQAREDPQIELVFMDIAMPGMDGYETIARLKSEAGFEGVIVALTAYAMREDREKCLRAGAHDYLAKPVAREDIARLFGRWFGEALPARGEARPTKEAGTRRA